jgi:hypothetical protein
MEEVIRFNDFFKNYFRNIDFRDENPDDFFNKVGFKSDLSRVKYELFDRYVNLRAVSADTGNLRIEYLRGECKYDGDFANLAYFESKSRRAFVNTRLGGLIDRILIQDRATSDALQILRRKDIFGSVGYFLPEYGYNFDSKEHGIVPIIDFVKIIFYNELR